MSEGITLRWIHVQFPLLNQYRQHRHVHNDDTISGLYRQHRHYFFYVNIEVTCPTPFQQVDPCHLYPRSVKPRHFESLGRLAGYWQSTNGNRNWPEISSFPLWPVGLPGEDLLEH